MRVQYAVHVTQTETQKVQGRWETRGATRGGRPGARPPLAPEMGGAPPPSE